MVCAPSKDRIYYCLDKEIIRFLELVAASMGKRPPELLEEIILWWAREHGLEKALETIEEIAEKMEKKEEKKA